MFGLPVEIDKGLDTRFKGYRNAGIDIPEYLKKAKRGGILKLRKPANQITWERTGDWLADGL